MTPSKAPTRAFRLDTQVESIRPIDRNDIADEDDGEGDGDDEGEGAQDPPIPKDCGVQRVRVKMGVDSEAATVDVHTAKRASIEKLGALDAPDKIGDKMPRTGRPEHTVFTLRGVHLFYAKHEGDHDYHLAVDDGNHHTMVVEAIDPTCLDKAGGGRWLKYEQAARQTIDDAITVKKGGSKQDEVVSVVGVAFFDKIHGGAKGQKGHAPNGIELHPVLAICFGENCHFGK